jgi:hypothetical protein
MSRLVRLYPVAWQERYGDELSALLEDRPPGPFELIDLLLGAVDAHLHLRGFGTSEHRKGITMSLRLAGSSALASGGLWIVFFAIVAIAYAGVTINVGVNIDALWFPLVFGAGLLTLVGIAGLSTVEFRNHGRSIWIAFVIPAIGIGLVFVALARTLLTGDWDYGSGSIGVALLYPGLLLVLIGSAIFAAVIRTAHGPRRLGAVAIGLGAVVTLSGLGSFLPPIGLAIGGLAFGIGWIVLGTDAIRRDRPLAVTRPSGA